MPELIEIPGASPDASRETHPSRLNNLIEQRNLALQSAGVATWDWNIPEDTIFWDEHLQRLFGREPDSLIGTYDAFQRLVYPGDRMSLHETIAAALADHAEYDLKFRIVWPDGSLHAVRTRGKIYRDESGAAVRMIGVCWNISEQPSAEPASPESESPESESRVKLWQAMNEAAVAVFSAPTLSETAARLREQVSEMIGVSRAEVDLSCDAEEGSPSDEARLTKLPWAGLGMHDRAIRIAQRDFENHPLYHHFQREVGHGRPINGLLATRLRGRDSRNLGVLWLTDKQQGSFTADDEHLLAHLAQLGAHALELHHAQDEFESRVAERTEHLARTNAELEQFAYVASHDLQEPLRAIAGYCDLLRSSIQEQLTPECEEYLEHAVEGAKRMQFLIKGLLDISRIRTRAQPFEPVAMETLVNAAKENLGPAIRESGASVTSGGLPTIVGDSVQLMEVFQQLLDNAIKFRSERPPQVHVAAQLLEKEWLFSVTDNGIGIDPRYADRLFVIFQRLHNRAKYRGAGIGLALCKKVVEGHGGRIWLESELDQGTTFYFTVPNRKASHDGHRSRTWPPH